MKIQSISYTTALLFITIALGPVGCTYNSLQGFPRPGYDTKLQISSLSKAVDSMNTNLDSITTVQMRNTYIDQRITLIDVEYLKFLRSVSGTKNGVDAGSKIAVGALGAVGAIAGGGTAQAVSAASAATTAASGAIDMTYFYNQTMPAMISAMEADRKAKLVNITEGKLKPLNDPTNGYSVYQAASDLNDYYFAGTLQGASVSIQNNSSALSSNATQQIKNAPMNVMVEMKLRSGDTNFNPIEKQVLKEKYPNLDLK